MANSERTHVMSLRLSDDEYRILEAKTKLARNRSMSDTIRFLIIEGMVYDIDYSHLIDCNVQLGKIGTNLNQIAYKINKTGSIYQTDIDAIKREMEEIWKVQKSYLRRQPLAHPEIPKFISKSQEID